MFNKSDYNNKPNLMTISEYINNPLFDKFVNYMEETYQIKPIFEFSKCTWEYGWNIKFKKGSKTLCTLYSRENYFTLMVVIGNKEKTFFDEMIPTLNRDIVELYQETKEGNGQRWLMVDVEDDDERYADVKRIIELRNK